MHVNGISIHASRGGSDISGLKRQVTPKFQSTLPAGEATPGRPTLMRWQNFNPRFPRGKRQLVSSTSMLSNIFQSTLPAGEATSDSRVRPCEHQISIHASRGGSDLRKPNAPPWEKNISIHASRGGSDMKYTVKMSCGHISIHASRGGSDPGNSGIN